MLQAFKAYIRSTKLFQQDDRILLAVSGGVDSVAMVNLFRMQVFSLVLHILISNSGVLIRKEMNYL
jgi:tRNA(Ile)-lysidine synthase